MRQPLACALVGCCVHFEWKPFVNVGHELFVVLGIHGQLVVDWQNDSEPVLFFGVTLGRVDQELVVLHQQLDRAHVDTAINVDHHQVETRDAVLFVAVATIQVMRNPMQAISLSELVQLLKRCVLVAVVSRDVRAVAQHHLGEISLFQRLATEELDAVRERLLDDDVVLVAIGNSQREHLCLLACCSTIKRQVLNQISLGHITLASSDVLGQLHVWAITSEQLVERIA